MIFIRLNGLGVRELLKTREMQEHLNGRAERVAERARSLAPYEDGDYKDGIETRENPTPKRARAEVLATDKKSHLIESRNRVLGQAIDAARE